MKQCSTCRHFRPRPDDMPWPRATVSVLAEGWCGLKRLSTDERQWRCGTDWCDRYAKGKG